MARQPAHARAAGALAPAARMVVVDGNGARLVQVQRLAAQVATALLRGEQLPEPLWGNAVHPLQVTSRHAAQKLLADGTVAGMSVTPAAGGVLRRLRIGGVPLGGLLPVVGLSGLGVVPVNDARLNVLPTDTAWEALWASAFTCHDPSLP